MSFDKTKAMRNAERFLTQGKIRSAINEYKKIVEANPEDYSTLNILGDLYVKNSEQPEAIKCFMQVAEHYNDQGFSNKAIAIYNKISKIIPDSIEVSGKLAHLYHMRGSYAEARFHYKVLADNYESTGRKIEAIAIWNQIAELDPKNTEVYLKIAESSLREKQADEAAAAYVNAGLRFSEVEQFESAVAAFENSAQIKELDLEGLRGYVEAKIKLGCSDEAVGVLTQRIEKDPYDREFQYLLVDCYLDMNQTAEAEKLVVRLVEQEPSNYLKLVDLVELYAKENDLDSAMRVLKIASEYLLTGGQAVEFLKWTNEVLARNPESIEALQMLVRYHTWQRDEANVRESLERLAETAQLMGETAVEKNALQRLAMMYPEEKSFSDRLNQLGVEFGLSTDEQSPEKAAADVPKFESFAGLNEEEAINGTNPEMVDQFERFQADEYEEPPTTGEEIGFETFRNLKIEETDIGQQSEFETFQSESAMPNTPVEDTFEGFQISEGLDHVMMPGAPDGFGDPVPDEPAESEVEVPTAGEPEGDQGAELNAVDELKLHKEIESIEFYIDQGYTDIAVKSLTELIDNFGNREELTPLCVRLAEHLPVQQNESDETVMPDSSAVHKNTPLPTEPAPEEPAGEEFTQTNIVASVIQPPPASEPVDLIEAEIIYPDQNGSADQLVQLDMNQLQNEPESGADAAGGFLAEFRTELGLEEPEEPADENDYQTHYQTGIAYKEMGLMEDAIKEFQTAIDLVGINDGTHRFFQCANLLGHCFMAKRMPKLAITWFNRALETEDLKRKEIQGLNYELANAYEVEGDFEKAVEFFEKIYAEDVEYRDINERLAKLKEELVSA